MPMPHAAEHAPGSFCWIELATTDQAEAKRFYGDLFGWSAHDSPMGADAIYTMFQQEGRDVAACYRLRSEMASAGVPPHWNLYVAVASADDAAERAGELGARVVTAPFDVLDAGRMAVIEDPTGAVISVWEAGTHGGFGIEGAEGTLFAADLSTSDQERASQFYSELFGWRVGKEDEDPEHNYYHLFNGESYIGGILPPSVGGPGAPPHWLIYLGVADCDAATIRAQAGGAQIYMPPTAVEDVGRMAVLADPQGASFALFQAR
jgi:uncharacterized protein